MKKIICTLTIFLAITLVDVFSPTYAWVQTQCGNLPETPWPNGNLTYRLRQGSYPAGLNATPDILRAMNQFNAIPDTQINLTGILTNGSTVTLGGAGNEIGFADLSTFGGGFPPETIAVEFTGRTITGTMGGPLQCVITRTDIVFADNRIWRLGPLPNTRLGANLLSLGIVATHEIGHALTLAHSNGFLARMNASYPNSGPIGNNSTDGPLVDEIRAMRVLYQGTDSTTRDLVASRYKNNNAEIADLNQVKRASDNARVNTLNRGTAYYLDYSIENHGNTGENSVSLGFYFSTDRTITSSDFLLGNLIVNMGYGATQSSTVWLQLPNNTPTGLGYLGYVIDDASTVNEVDEVNNGVNLLSTVRDGSFRIN